MQVLRSKLFEKILRERQDQLDNIQGEKRTHLAVTNIGVRPTLGDSTEVSTESFILDYSGDLYGKQVRLEFYKMLRAEKKFACIDDLKAQISRDISSTREYFRK